MSETADQANARRLAAKLVRRYLESFNGGDGEAMLACLSEDVIHDVNQGERRHGLEKFKAFNARMAHHYKEQLRDITVMVSRDGARAAAEFNVEGTYLNSEQGLPEASGQKYALPAGTFFVIADDKITRVTTYYNMTDWLSQVAS